MKSRKPSAESPHQVRYSWTADGQTHTGRTVVIAASESAAIAKARRLYPHVTII